MKFYNSEPPSRQWHLIRKVFLLFLLVLACAIGLFILFRQKGDFPLILFNVLADTSLGLSAGLGTRFLLRQRNWLLQGLTSTAISIIGLAILGYLTGWKSGIGPFHAGLIRVELPIWANLSLLLPLQFGRSSMDLLDLAYMVIAVDTSWIALRAWKRSPRTGRQSLVTPARQSTWAHTPEVRPAIVRSVPVQKIRVPPGSRLNSNARRKNNGRPLISRPAASAFARPANTRSKRRNSLRHRPEVQLAVHEEHRCPYCLEDVNRKDSRGVVECQVCHTLHHKDCWDITGSCQVPHLNT